MTGLLTLLQKMPAGPFSDKLMFPGHFSEFPGVFRKLLPSFELFSSHFSGKVKNTVGFRSCQAIFGDMRKTQICLTIITLVLPGKVNIER
jgi:hypothetical protein